MIFLLLLSNLNWYNCSAYLSKTALCTLGTGYRFAWYGLAPGCNFISTVFPHVRNIPLNRNWYLGIILCNASCYSSVKILLFDSTLHGSDFSQWAYNIQCVRCVESSTCYLSHCSSYRKFLSWECACHNMSISHSNTRLIPRLWCPYMVNLWELASSVSVVTYWNN